MQPELISLLICTYNRSHCLDELLARLTSMFADRWLEILVFDDASNDDTGGICSKYKGKIRYFRAGHNVGYIEGRARLIKEARGEYLAFLDDDSCFVDSSALRQIRETFAAYPDCGVIACNIASPTAAAGQVPYTCPVTDVAEFIGCGHVFRAAAIRKIGSYPAFLSGYGAEEILIALRMLDAGFRIVLNPNLRVYHAEEASQRPVIERRAASLVNELAIVVSCYPLWLVIPGIAKKLLSHSLFNLRDKSPAALALAVKRLPSACRHALTARAAIRTRTLRHWLALRSAMCVAAAKREGTSSQAGWQEIDSMFVKRADSHG